MPHSTASAARSALVFLLAGALGCASDVLLPDPSGSGSGPVALTKYTGDQQTGTVGEQLAAPLVVKVVAGDQPAPDRKIAFLLTEDPAAGTITPDTATTDEKGMATVQWILGTATGDHLVVAQLVGDDTATQVAEFRAAAKAGSPDTVGAASVVAQPGRRKQVVATAPVVRVVDRFGNPVPDAAVTWQVTSGQGDVSATSTPTDATGKATVTWTLGNRIGVQKLTAVTSGSVTGAPVTFTATVLF
jgi:Bacterial Ig-like domain (group 1)